MGSIQSNYYSLFDVTEVSNFELGLHCFRMNDIDNAMIYFERSSDDNRAKWMMNLIRCKSMITSKVIGWDDIPLSEWQYESLVNYCDDLDERHRSTTGLLHYCQRRYPEAIVSWKYDCNDSWANLYLGRMYYYGHGVQSDMEVAIMYFKAAAEQGNCFAEYWLGKLYYRGEGVIQNIDMSYYWYNRAARKGLTCAQYDLGNINFYGEGRIKNYPEATKYYIAAAEQGHILSSQKLVQIFWCVDYGMQNYDMAMKWYRRMADDGDKVTQYNIANIYYTGDLVQSFDPENIYGCKVTRNIDLAIMYFNLSANQGYIEAQIALGRYYHHLKNYVAAQKWWLIAAERGNVEAQYRMGLYCCGGYVTKKDFRQAFYWYSMAAKQGHPKSQYNIALFYQYGTGTRRNCKRAYHYYNMTSNQTENSFKQLWLFQTLKMELENVIKDYCNNHIGKWTYTSFEDLMLYLDNRVNLKSISIYEHDISIFNDDLFREWIIDAIQHNIIVDYNIENWFDTYFS